MDFEVFAYAAERSDQQRDIFVFGERMALTELRTTRERATDVTNVEITMGMEHARIVARIGAIEGVAQVKMLDLGDGDGDPLDGHFTILRTEAGDWRTVMPALWQVIAEVIDVAPDKLLVNNFTYDDTTA